ncbi:hypothetical protein HZA71_00095 [Candidatus Falkowbacteria bacterium]|nr:hypothetical protein [Candidatus Falkowbacteria bacterium]
MEGAIRQEKKCPKCKALNILALNGEEISIICRPSPPSMNNGREEIIGGEPY